ncbi:MAG: hypothetical protein J7513_03410 [Solirubrobacteraceae bacterium]|nr:hypothetical protein [Solirubrobacteraceae bacterium]
MLDETLGAALLGGRFALRTAGVVTAPARALWRSPLGAPGRAFVGRARIVGIETRKELGELGDAAAAELTEALLPLFARTAQRIARTLIDDGLTEEVVQRLVSSGEIDEVVQAAVAGGAVDQVVQAAVASGAIDRVVQAAVAGGAIDEIVLATTKGDALERAARDVLAGPLPAVIALGLAELAERAAADPATSDRIVRIAGSPAVVALLVTLLESEATITLTEQVLSSPEMQRLIETIASSDEIRQVVAEQSAGLASDVTEGVRARSVRLDDAAEQAVRGLFRRGK